MESWYLLDESTGVLRTTGPFTREQLEGMAVAGSLVPESRVAAVGSSEWIPASSDPVLAGLFRSVPPRSPELVMPMPADGGFAASSFSFGAAFSLGLASFKSRWSAWLLLGLVWLAITIAIGVPQFIASFVGEAMNNSGQEQAGALVALFGACIGLVLQVLVGMPLFAGAIYAAAAIHGGDTQVSNVFAGFRRYGAAVTSGLLVLLIYIGVVVAAYIPMLLMVIIGAAISGAAGGGPGAAVAISAVLGVLVGLAVIVVLMALVVMRVLCAPVIAIDPAFGYPGAMQALRMSWSQTAGLGFPMMGLMVVAAIIAAATVLLLCVGYILIGIPLFMANFGAMYLLVHRNRMTARPASMY